MNQATLKPNLRNGFSPLPNEGLLGILTDITDGLVYLDRRLRVLLANDAIFKSTRLKAKELIGRNIFDVFPVVKGTLFEKKLLEALRDNKFVNFELFLPKLDFLNGPAWTEIRIYPSVDHAVILVMDITEKKHQQKVIDLLSKICEHTTEGMCFVDLRNKIKFVNKAFVKIHGYRKEEDLIDKNVLIMCNADSAEQINSIIDGAKAGKNYSGVLLNKKRTGELFPCRLVISYLNSAEDSEKGIIITAMDITSEEKLKKDLDDSQKLYETIFEYTSTPTVIVEEDTTIAIANKQFEQLSGHSKKDIEYKKSWTEFVAKKDLKIMESRHKDRRLGKDVPDQYCFEFVNKKGEHKNIIVHVGMIPGTSRSVASLLDVSEVASTNAQLEITRNDLERKNIAMKELLDRLAAERNNFEKNITANLEKFVLPTLYRLKRKGAPSSHLLTLESSLRSLTSSFGSKISDIKVYLSPREIEICNLTKQGQSAKEVADALNISLQTVTKHRKNIRNKFGITNKKVNLFSYLQKIQ